MYSKITLNLTGAKKRYETLDGKQYLVVPAVMMTEGVWTGSNGPLLYLTNEFNKSPVGWNHKPVVVYHPTINGEGVTACSPDVVETQRVGMLFNTAYDDKLRTECWLDPDRVKKVDNRIWEALEQNQVIEVSTGMYHDLEKTSGTFNGKAYDGIVRNITPDHLAILPDEKGAFSVADGGGLLRNADGTELSYDDIRDQIKSLLKEKTGKGYCYVCDLYKSFAVYEEYDDGSCCYKIGYKVRSGKVALDGEPEKVRKMTSYVTANKLTTNDDSQGPIKSYPKPSVDELSSVMKHQQFQSELQKKYSGVEQEGDWGGWVTDVFANYLVYSKDGKHFRLPYTYDNDTVQFGDASEVERVTEYRTKNDIPIDGTQSPYSKTINQGVDMAQTIAQTATRNVTAEVKDLGGKSDGQQRGEGRTNQVNSMISAGKVTEMDRQFLENLPDDGFKKVHDWVMKGAEQAVVPYSYAGVGDRSNAHAATSGSVSHNQQQTMDQYINGLPPDMQRLVRNGMAQEKANRNSMIQHILTRNNRLNPKWLEAKSIDELEAMASLAGWHPNVAPTVNYAGQAEIPMFLTDNTQTMQTDNAADEEILAIPVMEFTRRQA